MKIFRSLAFVSVFAILVLSCKTTSSPTGGTGGSPPVTGACSDPDIHQKSLDVLVSVSSALVAQNWETVLSVLVSKNGQAVISCAVAEVGSEASHIFQASADPTEKTKADRARAYLQTHPVGG